MRIAFWKMPVFVAFGLAVGACLTAAGAPRPNLTGRVEMSDGSAAKATIFIETAKPKKGTSTFCPSCYADCRKKASSDANGDFKIESLDPDLTFRVLIVGDGCTPQFVDNVDPSEGPLYASLEKRDLSKVPKENMVHGRVLDPKGTPIEGAAVESHGIREKDGGEMWGRIDGLDPLAVTDAKGEFVLTCRKPFVSIDVKVDARGFARKTFTELTGGDTRHDLTVTDGATVTGRVLFKGKPLANVAVGIVSTDRTMENFTGEFEIGTDTNGQFTFVNLPPNVQYTLYGIMNSMRKYGSVTASQVTAGGDDSTTSAGDIIVTPGHILAGKVILDDGKAVPANTRLLAGLEGAWDTLQTTLDKEGRFSFSNLPSSEVSMSVRVSGYHLSPKNASHERLNDRLVGRVDADITNLTILLDKGRQPERDYDSVDMEDRPNGRLLAGVEGGRRLLATGWQISGHVLDAKTGQPVASFQVTPGQKRYSRSTFDSYSRADGSNGVYMVSLNKRFTEPLLKVEAPGYLPVAMPVQENDATNVDIKLEPGSGPSGTVLLPDGKPAADVSLGLVVTDQQGMSLQTDGIRSWRKQALVQKTDADGHFAFKPELNMEKVAAAGAAGFKMVSLADLSANPKIILDAWGRVKGTLRRPKGPGTNEDLDLKFSRDELENPWSLQANCHAVTDDKGAFEFVQVPPGKLELTYRVKMGDTRFSGWRDESLQAVTVAPGQVVELTVDAREKVTDTEFASQQQPQLAKRAGPPIIGTIVSADGKPAGGAQVGLLVTNQYMALGKMTLEGGQDPSLKTMTDGSGHFTLPGVEGASGIAAVSEDGFAQIAWPAKTAAPTLQLQAWGTIHGTLHIGARLGTNETVTLARNGMDSLMYRFEEFKSTTDARGEFTIHFVPPGDQFIARQVSMGGGSSTQTAAVPVTVKAGGVTEVDMGGDGVEVICSVKNKDGSPVADSQNLWVRLSEPYEPKKPRPSYPRMRFYIAETNKAGSIVFEDVLPGKYDLSVEGRNKVTRPGQTFYNMVNLANKQVTVSGGKPGGKPIDLGVIELRTPHSLVVGAKATDFTFLSTEGKKIKLSEFHGKYVLLHFFYPRMTGEETISTLKNFFDTYGKDKRLAILGISYGPPDFLKKYAGEKNIKWTLGTVENPMQNLEVGDYTQEQWIGGGGTAYLISPDGKIAARGSPGVEMKAALERELGKQTSAAISGQR